MESGTSPRAPHAATRTKIIMLRALALSLVMFAIQLAPSAAEIIPPPVNCNDINTKQPTPPAISAAGKSSSLYDDEDSAAENELLEAANKSRELSGADPLRMDESLRQAARSHARLMVSHAQLEHQLSGEASLMARIGQASPLKMDRVGENIAYARCAPGANDVLMHSAPHRQNLLDRGFNVAGVAAIWSKGKLYVVQDFGHEVRTYSAQQSGNLVSQAVDEVRQQSGLPELIRFSPANLDKAACSLASEDHPNAHLLATAYDHRKIITYTQGRPEMLPDSALRLLRDRGVGHIAVGSCYARNAAYPTGMYWVAILLY
jgi:uncharacterized protein YkwD